MPVRRALSSKPVSKDDVVESLNREVLPVVREMRDVVNVFTAVEMATGTYILDDTDSYVECSGTFSVTLPSAVGRAGKRYTIKLVTAGAITFLTSLSQTIDQHVSGGYGLTVQWDAIDVISNGENWRLV